MPKEQPCLSERGPSAASSKKAKEKRNSAFLSEIHDTKDASDSSRRGSSCSSEKDSGFSDGSDWQQTDVEDQRNNKNHPRPKEPADTSHPGPNKKPGLQNSGNAAIVPAKLDNRPVYIIEDMVLKQPTMIQKRDHLLWRNGIRVSNNSGSSHMILFEQPSFSPGHLQIHQPSSRRSNATGKKPNTYLPILNSYPRIAPHPSNKPPDKSLSNQESQNLSKRVCTEKSNETPARSLQGQHLHKHPKLGVSRSGQLCSSSATHTASTYTPTAAPTSLGSPLTPGLHTASPCPPATGPPRNVSTGAQHHRFLNTVQILGQSGLLDITLRTKELLRQSNATEQDISQLRQHTELMCQAVSNPSLSLNGIAAWEHLHRVMAASGSYPNLKVQQIPQSPLHLDLHNRLESLPAGDVNRPHAADGSRVPSCSLATVLERSDLEESERLGTCDKASERVTFMSPDSSTG
ncbi:CLOCK-interacting pacemaker isoform X2 [Cololabis saira]|uniref:CLOCK-interacting pacemaker isoform X2 n=1 Tax=Cololabis saira TaxID=129043 RepID=UPI002AD4E360|nr:CLOCK-interacting pacemaker isoform X2 [Cololabis saira]